MDGWPRPIRGCCDYRQHLAGSQPIQRRHDGERGGIVVPQLAYSGSHGKRQFSRRARRSVEQESLTVPSRRRRRRGWLCPNGPRRTTPSASATAAGSRGLVVGKWWGGLGWCCGDGRRGPHGYVLRWACRPPAHRPARLTGRRHRRKRRPQRQLDALRWPERSHAPGRSATATQSLPVRTGAGRGRRGGSGWVWRPWGRTTGNAAVPWYARWDDGTGRRWNAQYDGRNTGDALCTSVARKWASWGGGVGGG
mmetsp:Transcript_48513/g.105213  ORF Transcript_48513/g.105213 Transcript_48513/m.105213 type:complete len:251 (-) Transcript_48513:236-988(-)